MTPPTSLFIPPAAPAPAAPAAPVAPASADFLLMLGQLVGAAVSQPAAATAGLQGAPTLPSDGQDTGEVSDVPDELLAAVPLSLPITPIEIKTTASAGSQSTALLAVAAEITQSRAAMAASEVQIVPDFAASEQPTAGDRVMSFDLPQPQSAAAESTSANRQVAASEAAYSRPVQTPVGSAAWADEIGSRLTMMTEQGRHTASLRLSPEHLGPLEIRIAMQDDQASVWFGAAHSDTRAAIETALPRLRELFEAQGLSLTDAGVSREPPRESRPATQASTSASPSGDDASSATVQVRLGLIDAYA